MNQIIGRENWNNFQRKETKLRGNLNEHGLVVQSRNVANWYAFVEIKICWKHHEFWGSQQDQRKSVKDELGKNTHAINEIKMFKMNRMLLNNSIFTSVDKVLIKHAIIRVKYHGDHLNGGGTIILINKVHYIVIDRKGQLIQFETDIPKWSYTKEDVTNMIIISYISHYVMVHCLRFKS